MVESNQGSLGEKGEQGGTDGHAWDMGLCLRSHKACFMRSQQETQSLVEQMYIYV
jgi:hypothetical protein